MYPYNWTGLPTIDLFSERIDKIRGKTRSTSSRCAACKLNTVDRSDDLSNNFNMRNFPSPASDLASNIVTQRPLCISGFDLDSYVTIVVECGWFLL